MPFGQRHVAINFYNICKGHFGSGGGGGGRVAGVGGKASKNKLKDTKFICPMTNVTILGVFCTHAQKEYGQVWEMLTTPILNILPFFTFFKTSNAFTQSLV